MSVTSDLAAINGGNGGRGSTGDTTSELASLNATGKGGADLSMPDRGTTTGVFNGDTYGADLSLNACNCLGSMSGTMSDVTMRPGSQNTTETLFGDA